MLDTWTCQGCKLSDEHITCCTNCGTVFHFADNVWDTDTICPICGDPDYKNYEQVT